MVRINKEKLFFGIAAALKLLLAAFLYSQNPAAGILTLLETALLTGGLYILPRKWRWVMIFFLAINIIQCLHIIGGGTFLVAETLMNLGATNVVSPEMKIRMILCLSGALLAYLPDFFLKLRLKLSRRRQLVYAGIFLAAELLLPLPFHSIVDPVKETVQLYFIDRPDLLKGARYYRKNIADSGISGKLGSRGKNIILIFTEGTSYKCISKELTPTLWGLMKESLSFEDYFNHTAATFRGIRGQLISGYPAIGGVALHGLSGFSNMSEEQIEKLYPTRLPTLPRILAKHGYSCQFFSPHSRKEQLGAVMKIVGFSDIQYAEDYIPGRIWISDQQLYDHLWNKLEQRKDSLTPFFIALYPSGTHHGFNSPDIRYKDGKNAYLNKFYRHDHWLGKFLEKFKKSRFADNTIIIITADHAIYPTPEAKALFKIKSRCFVDRIPLIIYNRNFKPARMDAGLRNSLALAPTILDMLGIHNEANYFLGNSLFTDLKTDYDRIAIEGKQIFGVAKDGSVELLAEGPKKKYRRWKRWLKEYYKFIW